jgi:hypothetical protein
MSVPRPPRSTRLFGEKNGLLSAVAEYGYARFIAAKSPLRPTDDPVDDLRSAWSLTVDFGLSNPELFFLIYSEPRSEAMTAAVQSGAQRMRARIQRVAAAGWLRVEESLAATIMQSSARGTLPEPGRASAARTLKANLPGQGVLSPSEHHLLLDWLDRLSDEPPDTPDATRQLPSKETSSLVPRPLLLLPGADAYPGSGPGRKPSGTDRHKSLE